MILQVLLLEILMKIMIMSIALLYERNMIYISPILFRDLNTSPLRLKILYFASCQEIHTHMNVSSKQLVLFINMRIL